MPGLQLWIHLRCNSVTAKLWPLTEEDRKQREQFSISITKQLQYTDCLGVFLFVCFLFLVSAQPQVLRGLRRRWVFWHVGYGFGWPRAGMKFWLWVTENPVKPDCFTLNHIYPTYSVQYPWFSRTGISSVSQCHTCCRVNRLKNSEKIGDER